jgi:hypothetical protein
MNLSTDTAGHLGSVNSLPGQTVNVKKDESERLQCQKVPGRSPYWEMERQTAATHLPGHECRILPHESTMML